jgi:hypothetical protein
MEDEMKVKNKFFKLMIILFSFITLWTKAIANYTPKLTVKFPFMSSYIDSMGNEAEDSLVRNRDFRVVLHNKNNNDSLSQAETTNDSGFAIFNFNYWHDNNPVESSDIRKIAVDFPNSYKYTKIGNQYEFEPLRFDSIQFSGHAQEEIIIILPMSIHFTAYTIGQGSYEYDFVVMADMHIANNKKKVYHGLSYLPDFGSPGFDDEDDDPLETESSIQNNSAIVAQINNLLGTGWPIKFVVCAGDLTKSAERSEFQRAKRILTELDNRLFYIPLLGNHDTYPYIGFSSIWPGDYREQSENEVVIGGYFNSVFQTQFDSLQKILPNWQESPLLSDTTWQTGQVYPSYYFNFAFNYQQYHFISTDFNSRNKASFLGLNCPGTVGPPDVNRGRPYGHTWNWLQDNISDEKMIAMGHHPYCISVGSNFSQAELDDIAEAGLLYKSPIPVSIGGHNHPSTHEGIVKTSYGSPFCYVYSVGAALNGDFYLFHVWDSVRLDIDYPPIGVSLPVTDSFSFDYDYDGGPNGSNAPHYYYWDFGDGTHSTESNPTHIFHPTVPLPPPYKVTLRLNTNSYRDVYISKRFNIEASPYNLHTDYVKEDSVRLAWDMDNVNPCQTAFRVRRDYQLPGQYIAPDQKYFIDGSVQRGHSYFYDVSTIWDDHSSPEVFIHNVNIPWVDSPSNLTSELMSLTQVQLNWTNNSNYTTGFNIARKINDYGIWNENYATVWGANNCQFADNNISEGNRYYYKVRAFDSDGHLSSWSNEIEAFTAVANSGLPTMTALNNTSRIANGGGKLHLVYTGTIDENGYTYSCIYYTYSNDNGKSWAQPETVPWSVENKFPSIALDSQNRPYIFFGKWFMDLNWNLRGVLCVKDNEGWHIDTTRIFGSSSANPPPYDQYSIFMNCDTAFVVMSNNYCGDLGCWTYCFNSQPVNGSRLVPIGYRSDIHCWKPSIVIDCAKRVIISYNQGNQINILYKDPPPYPPNQDIWDTILGPNITNLTDYSMTVKGLDLYIASGACDYSVYVNDGEAKVWKVARNQEGGYNWENEFTYENDYPQGSPTPVILDNGNCVVWSNTIDTIYYNLRNGRSWGQPKALHVSFAGISSIYPQAYIIPNGIERLLCAAWTDSISDGQHSGPPYWISYANEKIPVWRVPANNATGPNNGELLTFDETSGNIHMVFNTGSTIAYSKSTNKGETWTDVAEIDSGANPTIVLDTFGLTRISYVKNDTVFCKALKPDSTWKTVIVYAGDENGKPSNPVIAKTYPKELAQYCYCVFPLKNPSDNQGKAIKVSVFDINQDNTPTPQEVTNGDNLKSPSIAITPGDYLHIVWEENGEIYYRTSLDKIVPGQDIAWSEIYNISESPEVISEHPVIEAYGENIIVAWKEGEPGEIVRRVRNLAKEGIVWLDKENISQSPDNESDYPVLSTMDVVAWQEEIDSSNFDIYAWIKGNIVNLSETENSSKYPHIAVEPLKGSFDETGKITIDPKIAINAIWTEEITPESLYEVKFKRYEYSPTNETLSEYIKVEVGDSTPSTYCENRTGFVDYGEFSCDYSSSPLLYNLPYLNPKSNYALRAVVYREGSGTQSEEMYVDTTFVTEVIYTPYVPETVCVILPKETYENDLEVSKEIERVLGSYAILADLKIYEVSLVDSTLANEGAQGQRRNIRRYILYQNQPNPFKDLTKIAFSLPRECKVSLFVYNVTGRRVRTLIDGKMKPGDYNVKWDGKENQNKKLSNGIYFYRLQTEDFKDTKKTILLK